MKNDLETQLSSVPELRRTKTRYDAQCLETRSTAEGFRRRTYRVKGTPVKYQSIEVPLQVWKCVQYKPKVEKALNGWYNEVNRQLIKDRALKLVAEGDKPDSVAYQLKVARTTVYKWIKETK